MTLTGCAPLAVSTAVGASAVVHSTAAPLPLLDHITDVRFFPAKSAKAVTVCPRTTATNFSLTKPTTPSLRHPDELITRRGLSCEQLRFKDTIYPFDETTFQSPTIFLNAQNASELIDFFNARQYRWQKGVPIRSYPAIHPRNMVTSHELRFYSDSELVQTIKFEYHTLVSSLHGQTVHREMSKEEWKWLNDRIPLTQSAGPRHPARDHLGERNFALRDRLQ